MAAIPPKHVHSPLDSKMRCCAGAHGAEEKETTWRHHKPAKSSSGALLFRDKRLGIRKLDIINPYLWLS